jgi:hypothetical protein
VTAFTQQARYEHGEAANEALAAPPESTGARRLRNGMPSVKAAAAPRLILQIIAGRDRFASAIADAQPRGLPVLRAACTRKND